MRTFIGVPSHGSGRWQTAGLAGAAGGTSAGPRAAPPRTTRGPSASAGGTRRSTPLRRSPPPAPQPPPDLVLGGKEAAALKALAAGMAGRVRIALEARAHEARPLPVSVASALRDVGGIDVVDLSKGDAPRVAAGVLYTRPFGGGGHNAWGVSEAGLPGGE